MANGEPAPKSKYFALIPAAGSGMRMGSPMPKQYLPLAGKPLLMHCVAAFAAHPKIARIGVVLAPDNTLFDSYDWSGFGGKVLPLRAGGATRSASVSNGLAGLAEAGAHDDDWVLVHDAARPGLSVGLIDRLMKAVGESEVGGLLALPVVDTLKRATGKDLQASTVEATVPRERLWAAQTPQMFRLGLLRRALGTATDVTDEASAVEALGLHPLLVAGALVNMKVTYAGDLEVVSSLVAGAWFNHAAPDAGR